MLKKLYLAVMPIFLLLITGISAYSYQIPVCNSSLNSSCISITGVSSIIDAPYAMMYYRDGSLFLTNDTLQQNLTGNVTNINYINFTNLTQITQQTINQSYFIINNSNGTSFIFQPNVTVNNTYVNEIIQQLFSNLSKVYNKSESDDIFATKAFVTDSMKSLENYLSKGEFDTRLSSIGLVNSNGTAFNFTQMSEYIDDRGDFSMIWKVLIIIETVIVILLVVFVVRMGAGG